jgi:hypothetical protein
MNLAATVEQVAGNNQDRDFPELALAFSDANGLMVDAPHA